MAERGLCSDPSHRVTTARLDLQPVRPSDAPALHAHWTAPDVRRFLWDDALISRRQVEDLIARSERLFDQRGYGLWALREHGPSGLIGCGGFWPFHEPLQIELVLSLAPQSWGRGIASEACSALISHGARRLGMEEVRASTDASNLRSRRLIERLGFAFSHRTEAEGLDTVFYVLRADP